MKHLAKTINDIIKLIQSDLDRLPLSHDELCDHRPQLLDISASIKSSLELLEQTSDILTDFEGLHDSVQKNLYEGMEIVINNLVIMKKAVLGPQPKPQPTMRYSDLMDSFPEE